jgi:hypothetical protein
VVRKVGRGKYSEVFEVGAWGGGPGRREDGVAQQAQASTSSAGIKSHLVDS